MLKAVAAVTIIAWATLNFEGRGMVCLSRSWQERWYAVLRSFMPGTPGIRTHATMPSVRTLVAAWKQCVHAWY